MLKYQRKNFRVRQLIFTDFVRGISGAFPSPRTTVSSIQENTALRGRHEKSDAGKKYIFKFEKLRQFGNVVPHLFVQALHMPRSKNSSGVYRPKYKKAHFSLVSLSVRPRVYTVAGSCGRQRFSAHAVHASSHTPGSWCPTLLWVSDGTGQATLSGPCRACLVSHPWQLVPYSALGLGRDGTNNLASSRLESWALDDPSVEKTPCSVLDSTKCPHKYRDIE